MRILIADDSIEIARRLQRLLLEMPFVSAVVVAPTIDTAIEGLLAMKPDLLILDHHFPDGKGHDILLKAGIRSRSVHVVVFSAYAYADTFETEAYENYHVDAVLDKTRDLDTLLEIVAAMHEMKINRSQMEASQN